MIFADPPSFSIQRGVELRRSEPEQIEKRRRALLREHLFHAQHAPYYRRLFTQNDISPMDVATLDDLSQIPLTDRAALSQQGQDFVPDHAAICDISHTSGTTGEPVIVPYSGRDLHRLAYNEAMAFTSAGVVREDRILLTVTLDRGFIAGLAYYSGAVLLGAAVIRSGPGQPAQQWKLIKELKPTILLGVPSFLLALARWGEGNGLSPQKSSIRALVTIGETVQNSNLQPSPLGALLKSSWGVPIFSSYGATEVETAFGDCKYHSGGHIHPEMMIAEIIDERGNVLPPGKSGELVVTPLGVEGFPLVRFRTGDISRIHTSTCGCGWNTERLGPIEGRISQRLKFKGTTLYPEMILQALQQIPSVDDCYIEVRQNFELADDITVVVASEREKLSLLDIKTLLSAHLRVTPRVKIGDIQQVGEKTGKGRLRKPQRFFDLRRQE